MHTNGIIFQENFIEAPEKLFAHLLATVQWDERMAARKTASFGVAYNYSQISYSYDCTKYFGINRTLPLLVNRVVL